MTGLLESLSAGLVTCPTAWEPSECPPQPPSLVPRGLAGGTLEGAG